MTAINALIQGNRVLVMADKAWISSDGTVSSIASKFIRGTSFNWGIAFTGNPDPVTILNRISAIYPTNASQMLEALPRVVRQMTEEAEREKISAFSCGLLCAMWSKKRARPALVGIDNDGRFFPIAPAPFVPVEITYSISSGDVAKSPSDWLGREVDMCDANNFRPDIEGVELMAKQRSEMKWAMLPGDPICHRIGGGVQLMTVGRRGVTVKEIHEWPDEVGKPIDSFV